MNDVLVAALTAALARISHEVGTTPRAGTAMLWVSLHSLLTLFESTASAPLHWGNSGLAAVHIALPMRSSSPAAMLSEVRDGVAFTQPSALVNRRCACFALPLARRCTDERAS